MPMNYLQLNKPSPDNQVFFLQGDTIRVMEGTSYYPSLAEEIQKVVGNRLRQERNQRCHSQQYMADLIYCSKSTLSSLENGSVFKNYDLLFRLCDYYGLMVGKLIQESHLLCLSQRCDQSTPSGQSTPNPLQGSLIYPISKNNSSTVSQHPDQTDKNDNG